MEHNLVVLNDHVIDNNKVLLQNIPDGDQKKILHVYYHNNIYVVYDYQVMYQDKVQALFDVFHIDHHIYLV